MNVPDGWRITKNGQNCFKQTLGCGESLNFNQNPSTDGYSKGYQVRVYSNGVTEKLGSVPEDSVEIINELLMYIYYQINGDFNKFVRDVRRIIKPFSRKVKQ